MISKKFTPAQRQALKIIGIQQTYESFDWQGVAQAKKKNTLMSESMEHPKASSSFQSKPMTPAKQTTNPSLLPTQTIVDPERIQTIENSDWNVLQTLVQTCQACGLAKTRTQTVFGDGNQQADWMIVGEAPGAEEDRQGLPFVGQAGKLLGQMLQAIGLSREQVYISNVLKCRPPQNRNPEPNEMACCEPFLKRQLTLIQPKIIIAMGRFAVTALLQDKTAIGALRLKTHFYAGIPLVVTYHPAYLLRSPTEKSKSWRDLCFAAQLVEKGRH